MSRAHHPRAAAWELYFTTTARLTERIEAALKCQAGLSMPEYSVLLMTDRAGEEGVRPSRLAHQVVFSRSRLTHTMKRLESRGLIERRPCAGAGRGGLVFLTQAGKTWILTIFTVVIIGVLVVLARRVHRASTLLAIALLAGGAVGNLIDRLTAEPGFGVGHVTDFIAYGNWFVGNVADIWIVLGAPLLALALSREPSKEHAQ